MVFIKANVGELYECLIAFNYSLVSMGTYTTHGKPMLVSIPLAGVLTHSDTVWITPLGTNLSVLMKHGIFIMINIMFRVSS